MSRLKRFTLAVLTSYAVQALAAVSSLISLPLALKYLGKEQFGIWALTAQLAGYVALLDMGMRFSGARVLVDHKDNRADGRYGSVIKTSLLVGALQGTIVVLFGGGLIHWLPHWLRIPSDLTGVFFWLMIGQLAIVAAGFFFRVFGQILTAWQRVDICNYGQLIQVALALVLLWIGFRLGWGIYALVIGLIAGWICGTALCGMACSWLKLWPKRDQWGRASKDEFRELFNYGTDVFLITLGTQFILSSQTILAMRLMNVAALAVWAILSKTFTLITQFLFGTIGNSMVVFAEMQVRGEKARLWARYRALFILSTCSAAILAVLFAACNGPFVSVWTGGKAAWPQKNDILLAIWLLVLTQQCCHNSLLLCLKKARKLSYVYVLEGVLFTGLAFMIIPKAGFPGMIVCSLLSTILCTYGFGLSRVVQLTSSDGYGSLWRWHLPMLKILVVMVPCWLLADALLVGASPRVRLCCLVPILGVSGIAVAMGFALPHDVAEELLTKIPIPFRKKLLAA